MKNSIKFYIFLISLLCVSGLVLYLQNLGKKMISIYQNNQSTIISDRSGEPIIINRNQSGYYATYAKSLPDGWTKLLLAKEDRYFYYHPGINPVSALRSIIGRMEGKKIGGSTISQQLAKILLQDENDRNWHNKIKESIYALGLESITSKEDILLMYSNSAYFGNGAQGIVAASNLYFDKSPEGLNDTEISSLITTISSPTEGNPFKSAGSDVQARLGAFNRSHSGPAAFEISPFMSAGHSARMTIDQGLTRDLRDIAKNGLQSLLAKNSADAAIVVIKEPENELLAIIGSPDPDVEDYGYQINMAVKPRPIGSTIKPLLYLKGFEDGLRPYSLVDDREYKYIINDGWAFYPKNYDFRYHGIVNLHYALSNSLNVPSVKVLEYVGIDEFGRWLTDDLSFSPLQDIHSYQLGVALGGLESDLLSLAHYYSIFTNGGRLRPLKISDENISFPPTMSSFRQNGQIVDEKYVELVNKILSDRQTGVEQFGANSSLNLPHANYAVKTGTSREFHDSWTVGYTPDFIVAVWVGNSDNTAMDGVSGQMGAGRIWDDAMNRLYDSRYSTDKSFSDKGISFFLQNDGIEYGLPSDDYEKAKNILLEQLLIMKPHDNDIFLLEDTTDIPLESKEDARWKINGKFLGNGSSQTFSPKEPGTYEISATTDNKSEKVHILVKTE